MTAMPAGENDLVTIEPGTAFKIFTTEGAIEPILQKVREFVDAFVPDISTDAGRKRVASMAFRITRAKTYLEEVGKKLADEQKAVPKKIDATRRTIKDTLDEWRDEVRKPLTDWESAEEARLQKHKDAIGALVVLTQGEGLDAATLRGRLAMAEAVVIGDECEEFTAEYAVAKDEAVRALKLLITAREKHEADQAELARLRAESEARRIKDREEQVAREAAERAGREAAEKAAAELQRVEAAAKAEREAAERRELELKLQADRAQREAREAAERAQRELEAKAAREAADKAKREADRLHRGRINREALNALVAAGLTEAVGKKVVGLIAEGKVPNVVINY